MTSQKDSDLDTTKYRTVHVECDTPANFRTFKHLLTLGAGPAGRFAYDGSVVIIRPAKFREVLAMTNGRIVEGKV